jgi:hypothetical protein
MTSFTQTRRALALSATLLAAVACGNDSRQNVNVAVGSTPSKERPLGAGDVRITSTDNVLVLAVIGDTVRMQLSDSLRNTVADNVDSSMRDKGAISDAIAKSVSSVVNSAMGFMIAIPASDVENLRYADGHLRFDVKGGKANVDMDGDSRNKATFTAEDARRFIDAVHARQGPLNR